MGGLGTRAFPEYLLICFYLIYLSFPGKIVLFLQFLQAEPYSTNASGVRAFVSRFKLESVPEPMHLRKDMSCAYKNLVER